MSGTKCLYQRLYGYMCVLLLLQEFHVVMPTVQPKQRLSNTKGFGSYSPFKEVSEGAGLYSRASVGRKGNLDVNPARTDLREIKTAEGKSSTLQTASDIPAGDTVRSLSASKFIGTRQRRSSHPDVKHVQNHLRRLSQKLKHHTEGLVSKAVEYIKDCSDDHSDDIEEFGGSKTPTGIITRLILALLYTLVDCDSTARGILVEIIDDVGKETVVEVLDTIQSIAEDMENQGPKKTNVAGDVENEGTNSDDNDEDTEEDNAFLSELLTENILNTQEMMKLMEVVANGNHFENVTELDEVVTELDEFGLDELLDRPNYIWMSYSVDAEVNFTEIEEVPDSVIDSLNSQSTRRLIREMTIPVQVDSKTRLLILYDESSHQLVSVTEEGVLTLSAYDESNLQHQLWVLSEGILLNVESHLALSTSADGNGSSPVLLGKIDEMSTWRMWVGRLSCGQHPECFLRVSSVNDQKNTSFASQSIIVDCEIDGTDVNLHVVFFKDAATPEKLIQHFSRPLSYLESLLMKLANTKFMIFIYMINYIFKSSVSEKKESLYPKAQTSVLQNKLFFIKNEHMRCKVLTHVNLNENENLLFQDFSETSMEFQLWYWKENQLINVGSHTALELNVAVATNDAPVAPISKYFRLWEFDNGTITTLNNKSCVLVVDKLTDKLVVECGHSIVSKWSNEPWTFVMFDKPNFKIFVDIVCLYFIQSSLWPCEFMTSSVHTHYPLVSPLADDIFTQLWYMSNGRLINAESGYALSEVDNNGTIGMRSLTYTGLTSWQVVSGQIITNETSVTIDTGRNGQVVTRPKQHFGKQTWKFISFKDASADSKSLSCNNELSDQFRPFVIRNQNVPACQLLTVVEREGTFHLKMSYFDETYLDRHLWVMHRGVIINVAYGLSLEPEMTHLTDGENKVIPRKLHAFQQRQMWSLDESGILRWKPKSQCFIDYQIDPNTNESVVSLNCIWRKRLYPKWKFTELPKNETELADVLNFMCFYFLRSNTDPCQYVTANSDDGTLHLRPLVANLLEKQIWYWNNHTINLVTTGQGFESNTMDWLTLQNPVEEGDFTYWTFRNGLLISQPDVEYISTDLDNDGRLFLSNSTGEFNLHLLFVNYDDFPKDGGGGNCSVPLEEDTHFFFIRSHLDSCLLLTGTDEGNMPTFKNFDQDYLESQLWFYSNNHIINLKTNLVLHADDESRISGSRVVMRPYYMYANQQKWIMHDNMIYYGSNRNCVLDVARMSLDDDILVWCDAHGGYNQRWDRINFDDDSGYLDEITCMFFLRHELTPCELLTYVNGTIVLRPSTDQFFNQQIWYWSGESIVHAASGLVLDASSYSQLSLKQKNGGQLSQRWMTDSMYVVSKASDKVIGLDSATSQIKILNRYTSGKSSYIRWSFIGLEDGLEKPSLLSCEKELGNPTIYFLRSDKEPCHVLSENGNGDITLLKTGKGNSNQAWVKIRRHIVSMKTGKVLSVDIFTNGQHVKTQTRYEHEIKQHWVQSGSSVQMISSGNVKLLDAYGDVCIWTPDNSDGQKWIWLNVKDVEKDNKLLRCSKCYNKKEEKANEVMSYIPIFGWLYSLIRAPVYAAKGCEDVALETLRDFAIGAAFDIGIGIITVLTAGTASGLAYAVKTAAQSGIRAGLKAALKAITSSISLAVRQAIGAGKVVLKQGLKRTVISLSKKGLTNIKYTLKSNIRAIKHLPSTTKSLVVKSASSVKKVSTKVYNSIRSTTYGSFKSSTANGLRKLPSALKNKLNKIGNSLAEKAENKIKRLEDLKRNKPTSHVRCKRAGSCKGVKQSGFKPSVNANLPKPSAFVASPDQDISNNFAKLLKSAKENNNVNLQGWQNAHFSISVDDVGRMKNIKKGQKKPGVSDENVAHSAVLGKSNELPVDTNYRVIESDKTLQPHTEQTLIAPIEASIRKTCPGKKCELYLWTKNSPCMRNTYGIDANNKESSKVAKSCFTMLLELCNHHVKKTKGFTMCHIGFQDYYGLAGPKPYGVKTPYTSDQLKEQFMKELSDLTETAKNLHRHTSTSILDNIGSFIKFYHIIP